MTSTQVDTNFVEISNPPPANSNMVMPKVEDALTYLESVKLKYIDSPHVYSAFLDVMKDFQSGNIDTEGVIKTVTSLFNNDLHLLVGFNTFLPPGYKITVNSNEPSTIITENPINAGNNSMEFDQAVQFVAKVKSRFSSSPKIYEEFLECLHSASATTNNPMESSVPTIEDVFNRVQTLFAQHPDLIKEFRYFLPVNSGISEPLPASYFYKNRNAAALRRGKGRTKKGKRSIRDKDYSYSSTIAQQSYSQDYDTVEISQPTLVEPSPPSKMVPKIDFPFPPNSEYDVAIFEKIKSTVPWPVYAQMIKCINLYNNSILTRLELLYLVRDILSKTHSDLYEKFRTAFGYSDARLNELSHQSQTNYHAIIGRLGSMNLRQASPSYKYLPFDLILPVCSSRNNLADLVLNDICKCTSFGSEAGSNFKISRKNQYEDALFLVEDNRFELDRHIETLSSTITSLESIHSKLTLLTSDEQKRYKILDDQLLNPVKIRAINRLYNTYSKEILSLLKNDPLNVIPILISRMKNKVNEWINLRDEKAPSWKFVMEKNYLKSLDHRSFYYKHEEKNRLRPSILIQELYSMFKIENYDGEEVKEPVPKKHKIDEAKKETKHGLRYSFSNRHIFNDIYVLVKTMHERNCQLNNSSTNGVMEFLAFFLFPFFGVNTPSDFHCDLIPSQNISDEFNEIIAILYDLTAPLASSPAVKPLQLNLQSPPLSIPSSKAFLYSDNTFYLVFRYFHYLFSKLEKCAIACSQIPNNTDLSYYDQYINHLISFLKGFVDITTFEENIQKLMGVGSYEFITIDKVLATFTNYLNSVLSNYHCSTFLSLYKYFKNQCECYKDNLSEKFNDFLSIYQNNVLSVLQGDPLICISVESVSDSIFESFIYLVNGDSSDNMTSFTTSKRLLKLLSSSFIPPKSKSSFLKRNLKICNKFFKSRKKKTHFINNLEFTFSNQYNLIPIEEGYDILFNFPLYATKKKKQAKGKTFQKKMQNKFKHLFPGFNQEEFDSFIRGDVSENESEDNNEADDLTNERGGKALTRLALRLKK